LKLKQGVISFMKAKFKLPKTSKGWLALAVIFIIVLLGSWPVIPLLNNDAIVLGMPILMTWSVMLIFLTTAVLWGINKIGGADD